MNIEKQVEFDKIKQNWSDLAITDGAKEQISNMSVFFSENELRKQIQDTTDSRNMIDRFGTPPLPDVRESKDVLKAAEKGECLTPYQLERVEGVLASIKRMKDYLKRGTSYEISIAWYHENLDTMEELREEICQKIRNEAVDDHASRDLQQIRRQITRCEEQMRQKADQVMRSYRECMADHYSTQRNGRLCVPVKKEYKLKIPGSVIDKSATGSTFFIEPSSVSKCYDELQIHRINEENEVYQILYTLTALVAEKSDQLREDIEVIEKLDFIFSKGKFSADLDAVEPLINTERRIVLTDARHPLMDRQSNVPLQFEMGKDIRGIVITGPNTGGKTVAIKTVMLNCMMAQCGLHVPCREADLCMNSSYLCDIGDGQNLAENLSTFSAHIKNVLEVLQEVDRDSLVVLDELGSGTDPAEGMGIAVAVLEELRKSGCLFLVTTHYPEVKEYAEKTEDIINARMTFDKETLRPMYQMVIGEAGESCAFYISGRLGMPAGMLKAAAYAAYGENAVLDDVFQKNESLKKDKKGSRIQKAKGTGKEKKLRTKFSRGDSVMVFPDKKTGIVCEPVNEKGVLRVQLPDRKIWINHKRVKLQVAATRLYPEDYDFSIVFDSVEQRKIRHEMERKYTEKRIEY